MQIVEAAKILASTKTNINVVSREFPVKNRFRKIGNNYPFNGFSMKCGWQLLVDTQVRRPALGIRRFSCQMINKIRIFSNRVRSIEGWLHIRVLKSNIRRRNFEM